LNQENVNTIKMNTTPSIQKTARFAGIAYFVIIITSVLSISLGSYRLRVEGDLAKTIENIASNQLLFRIGIVYEILMYTGVILLSVALYQLLKGIHRAKALTALLCRFGEALMGMLTVIGSILILFMLSGDFAQETVQNSVSVIFEIQDACMSILMVFIGVGSILFLHLFYRSRYIPRWLSVFGIVAFAFVALESLVVLLYPMQAWTFPGLAAILFEIVIGLWLMIKGVKIA
jgi:hypothetical protein